MRALHRYAIMSMALIAAIFYQAVAYAQDVAESLPEDAVNFEWWQIITGFVLPLGLSFIQQSKWSQKTQAFVAFGASLVVTLVQCYIYDQLDNFTDPAQAFGVVFALTITFYKGWWKPTGISPAIERATNIPDRNRE